ncbi:MAG: type II toxin-antitoxin system RelE/ParE family toxin [Candidatus Aminicenantales bacterium]
MAQKDAWEIVLTGPAQRVYDKVSRDIRQRLDSCFEDLEKNPVYGNRIRPLSGQLRVLVRYRVGDWRVVFRLFEERKTVEIVAILPRGDAY